MLYDKDIREPLFDFLEERFGKCRMIEEKIMGLSRADIVMITPDSFYGIEIKSDRDSFARLSRQVKDYELFFDYNFVVVGSSHAHHIREHVPEHWGIITVEEPEGTDESSEDRKAGKQKVLDFYVLREPAANPNVVPSLKLSLLWRPELCHIQELNGMPAYKKLGKKKLVQKIVDFVDYPRLRLQMSEELFERDYTTIGERIDKFRVEEEHKKPKRRRTASSGIKSSVRKSRKKAPNLLVSKVVHSRRRKG